MVFENGILRRIWGPVFDRQEGVWRRRHNEELRQISEIKPITNILRSQRLRWAGHVARMDEERTARRAMFNNPHGRKPVGRPRMRWKDNIKKDATLMEIEDPDHWWDVARDRGRWKRIVKAAKDQQGPVPAE